MVWLGSLQMTGVTGSEEDRREDAADYRLGKDMGGEMADGI